MKPAETAPDREYVAFISYRHKPLDKKAAERIQRSIERYTVPREYREQVGGNRLGKVFRDEDELPVSSSLSDSITYALDHSKYLIVICTPDLPKSAWCEQEIRYFTGKYGRDRVIAVLVDGDPSESFSPLMLHTFDEAGNVTGNTEPLGANIAGKNHTIDNGAYRKEIVRIYAALIGCPFDALWQRERRRKMNRLFAAVGAAAVLLAGFSAVVLSKNAEITRQYDQIASQNEQITEQYDQIASQNEQITEQNEQITEQNRTLQRQLSSMQVDAGYTALKEYDIDKALESGLSALIPDEDGEEVYDRRVRALLSETLGVYDIDECRTEIIYRQNVPITQLLTVGNGERLLVADEVGVLRCLEIPDGTLVWETQMRFNKSYDKDYEVVLAQATGLILCKGPGFVTVLSLEDGSELWRYDYVGNNYGYKDDPGTGLRGISPDGKTLVLLDGDPEKDESSILIVFDMATGTEKARLDLAAEGRKVVADRGDKWFYNTADFSEDGKRLAVTVFSEILEEAEEGEETSDRKHRCDYLLIDTDSWTVLDSVFLDSFAYYGDTISYGCVLAPETYDLFCAQYRSEFGGIVINSIHWKDKDYKTRTITQTIPAPGGWDITEPYSSYAVHLLASGKRAAVPSANTLYLFDRDDTRPLKGYEFTDAILDAWWNDSVGQKITVLLANGSMAYFDSEEGYLFRGYGFTEVKCSQAISGGIISEEPGGAVLCARREEPGVILLSKVHNSDGIRDLPGSPEEYHAYSSNIQLSPDQEQLYFWQSPDYGTYTLNIYDYETLKIIQTADFTVERGKPTYFDRDHFIAGNVIYGLDGSTETLVPQNGISKRAFEFKDFESVLLSSGQVLTVSNVPAGETGMTYCWLDGKAIEIPEEPGSAWSVDTLIGKNGLVVSTSPNSEGCYAVLDAMDGTLSQVENPYPEAEKNLAAVGTQKKIFIISDRKDMTLFDMTTGDSETLPMPYDTGEIQSITFVPGDETILVLTVSGKIDCWDLSSAAKVYSGNVGSYHSSMDNIFCDVDETRNELHVMIKQEENRLGDWICIDRKDWTEVFRQTRVLKYLPGRGEILIIPHSRLQIQEVYTVERLAELAREKLAQ